MATLSSNMVNVGVSMVLNDQFSSRAGRITDSYRKMMNQMRDLNQGISMSMGETLDKGVEIVKGMYAAYEKYAGVQDTIFLVTKMTGTTMTEGNKLLDLVNEINKQTPVTAEQIASGAKYLAMAGNKMPDIQLMLGPISKLASILGHEIGGKGGVADLLTNIMIGMNIPMSQVSLIADQIGAAVTGSNMSLQDFAQTMQYASATARTLQVPFDKVATTIGMLGNMGIQGSRAGTEFKNAYENMVKTIAGKKRGGQAALASIGMSPQDLIDAKGNMLSLEEVAVKIGESFKKLGITSLTEGVKKKGFFFDVYGMRGQSAIIDLVDQYLRGEDRFHELLNRIRSSQGFVDKTNEERMKQASGIIATFKATWENFIISYGKAIEPLFNKFLTGLGKVIGLLDSFVNSGFGKFVAKMSVVGVTVKLIWWGLKGIRAIVGAMLTPASVITGNINRTSTGVKSMNVGLRETLALLRSIAATSAVNAGAFTNAQIGALAMVGGYKMNKSGRWYNPKSGKFVSKQHMLSVLGAAGLLNATPGFNNQSRLHLTASERYANRVSAWERARGGKLGANWKTITSATGRDLWLSGMSPRKAGMVRMGIGAGKMGLWMVGISALTWAIEGISNLISGNKDSLDDNTSALDQNTQSFNDFLMAREQALVKAFTEAYNRGTGREETIIVTDPSGRVLGTGNFGEVIDASEFTNLGVIPTM